jgi:hypothetical protein
MKGPSTNYIDIRQFKEEQILVQCIRTQECLGIQLVNVDEWKSSISIMGSLRVEECAESKELILQCLQLKFLRQ